MGRKHLRGDNGRLDLSLVNRLLGDEEACGEENSPKPVGYSGFELSTSHLTKKDAKALSAMCREHSEGHYRIWDRSFGFVVRTMDAELDREHFGGMSENFHDIMRYAEENGYREVEFDADADVCALFLHWDW